MYPYESKENSLLLTRSNLRFKKSGINEENTNEALEVENKGTSESKRKVLTKLYLMRYSVCFLFFP